ncbi:hypothetical protein [Phaeobacter sp. B1627]|uniref:hypothetical protein n=1 Tax=Phaeobacter sp. B1627 TaxID=2583809 RepID=UPI00111A4CCF|nr:hypothetical protein [Phaeobacter sp. B1627]TNJ38830.1 hypothetical protein FGE21_19400 [Phaeobacter sp. B1627]
MPTSIIASSEFRSNFTQDQFGGNFLFHRDTIGDEGSYEELVHELGIEAVRFPGGSITEEHFDISNPNRASTVDQSTGQELSLIPLDNWLSIAGELNLASTIVVPTRGLLSEEADSNGDRYVEFDRNELYQFVSDVVQGVHGAGEIAAFEIGNEYWGAGQMSSVEYGRLSSEMSTVIDEALMDSQNLGFDTGNIDIVVQAGTNFDFARLEDSYSDLDSVDSILSELSDDFGIDFENGYTFNNGEIDWTRVNNELIMNEFNQVEIGSIDGVAAHVYTRGEANPDMRDFSTSMIQDTWMERNEDLETYVTEWNLRSTSSLDDESDYGLRQAHEMLEIVEQFPEHGVGAAHAWPILQNTRNALSSGFEHEELSVGGEMFRLMEESLPGNRPIDLVGSSNEETELSTPNVDVHAFGQPDELVLFLSSKSLEVTSSDFDLSGLISGGENISVTFLGVQEGSAPGDRFAIPDVQEAPASEIANEIFTEGVLHADLDALEVMRVVVSQPTWSEEMETYWEAIDIADDDIEGVFDGEDLIAALSLDPIVGPGVGDPDPEPDPEEEGDFDDGGGMGIAAVLIGLLPLLALIL